jgi:hypothetical protein
MSKKSSKKSKTTKKKSSGGSKAGKVIKESQAKANKRISSTDKKNSKVVSSTKKKNNKIVSSTKSKNNKLYSDYKKSKAYTDAQKAQGMTVNDVGKKYGMDFSQEYADKRAETEAQARRNQYSERSRNNDASHTTTNQRISDNYDSAAGALDTNYFKQFQNSNQSMANRGLNAGIAANAAVQLGMNRQNELGDLWKQRSTNQQEEDMRFANENSTISEGLDQVEKEKAMNAKNYYQDLQAQGYNMLQGDRQSAAAWAAQNYGMVSDQVANNNTYAGWGMNNNNDYANMYISNNNSSADRYLNNLSDYTKMTTNDIYDQMDRAERAKAAAATAAYRKASLRASRGSGGSGGGGGGSKSPASPYNKAKGQAADTPMDQYVKARANDPGYKAVSKSPYKSVHKYFNSPVKLADDTHYNAWQKMKIMGL